MVTNKLQQIRSWKANSPELLNKLCTLNLTIRITFVFTVLHSVPILIHTNPPYNSPPYNLNVHFNIICPPTLTPGCLRGSIYVLLEARRSLNIAVILDFHYLALQISRELFAEIPSGGADSFILMIMFCQHLHIFPKICLIFVVTYRLRSVITCLQLLVS